jgi:hypothetical protein
MKIPKSVKVGKTKILINQPVSLMVGRTPCRGSFNRADDTIEVAKKDIDGDSYSAAQRAETFWHELTHAILHDMKSGLSMNEEFVTKFSKRLDQAIKTAEFK